MSVLAIGLTAGALGLGRSLPQISRLYRTRNAAGVSSFSLGLGIAQCMLWLGYGLTAGDVPQVVTNFGALTLVGMQAALILVIRRGRRRAAGLIAVSVGTIVLTALLAQGAPSFVGVLAATVGIAALMPQLLVAARGDDLSGLSLATWLMTIAAASLWLLYALLSDQSAVLATSMVAVVAATVIAWRVSEQRRLVDELDHVLARSYYTLAA